MTDQDQKDISMLITHKVSQRIPFCVRATFEVKDSIAQDFADAIVVLYEDTKKLEAPILIMYPSTWWDAFKERWLSWLFFVNVEYTRHVITPCEVMRYSKRVITLVKERGSVQ